MVNAKIRAMRAKLLTRKQYEALCSQSQPLPEIESTAEAVARLRKYIVDAKARRLISLDDDYIKAWTFIRRLPDGQNRKALMMIKGSEIDLQNIKQLWRLKQYYPAAEPYPQLIPVFYRLDKSIVAQMAESRGVAEFIVALRHSYYKQLSTDDIERAVIQEMLHLFSRVAKQYPRSMAPVMSYIFAKKIEARNLLMLKESIRYSLPPDEIMQHLIL